MVTKESEARRSQQEHEIKMKVLSIFENDPEMKYFVGAITGFGITSLNEYVVKYGLSNDDPVKEEYKPVTPFTFVPGANLVEGILEDSGKSLSAFCIACLFLKAIFGQDGLNSLI